MYTNQIKLYRPSSSDHDREFPVTRITTCRKITLTINVEKTTSRNSSSLRSIARMIFILSPQQILNLTNELDRKSIRCRYPTTYTLTILNYFCASSIALYTLSTVSSPIWPLYSSITGATAFTISSRASGVISVYSMPSS